MMKKLICLLTDHRFNQVGIEHGYYDCERCGGSWTCYDSPKAAERTLFFQLSRLRWYPWRFFYSMKWRVQRAKSRFWKNDDDVPF